MEGKNEDLKSQIAVRNTQSCFLLSSLRSFQNRYLNSSILVDEEKEMLMNEVMDLKIQQLRERMKTRMINRRLKPCSLILQVLMWGVCMDNHFGAGPNFQLVAHLHLAFTSLPCNVFTDSVNKLLETVCSVFSMASLGEQFLLILVGNFEASNDLCFNNSAANHPKQHCNESCGCGLGCNNAKGKDVVFPKWEPHTCGDFKLNSDGTCWVTWVKHVIKKGLIRDNLGRWIMRYTRNIGTTTSCSGS